MSNSHKRALAGIFFLFAFGMMSWVPRFPEVKANLGVSNGQFGTLLSLGAIGSLVSQVTAGHLVHRFGSRRVLVGSAVILYLALISAVHARETWIFLISNLLFGIGFSAFHIALNGQALHVQESTKQNLMPRLHGLWSLGALTTAVVSGLLAGRVSLDLHISVLALLCFLTTLYLLRVLKPTLLLGNGTGSHGFALRNIFTKSRRDWLMGVSFTCAVILEVAIGDWAAIFSREELKMSPGVSAIPYIGLLVSMILGRLTVHKILERVSLAVLVRRSVLFGGGIFIISIVAGVQINETLPVLGFVFVVFGSICAGLGASFLAPVIMSAANRSSRAPGSVVIGQLGAQNMVSMFFIKFALAWIAQFASIGVALLVPALLLLAIYFMADNIERAEA